MNRTGYDLGLVLNDFDRDVADLFQSSGQPIFAIINGVEDSASHDQWELLYSLRGYGSRNPPISTFKRHIDSVEAAEDGDPVVTITGGSAITEGGNASFTLTATPAPSASLDVSVSVADDRDSDFVASGNEGARTVTIRTGGTVSFTVATEDDEVDEANGSVSATVNRGNGYTAGMPSSASVTVNDDDEPPPPLPSEYINYLSNQGIPENQLQQDHDPDLDGVPNVFEYYFGSDASDTSSFHQPTPIIVRISSTPYIALQYVRDPSAVGVEIQVEFSDSPSFDSLNDSVQQMREFLENGKERVVVRSDKQFSGKEFSRLIYRSEENYPAFLPKFVGAVGGQ